MGLPSSPAGGVFFGARVPGGHAGVCAMWEGLARVARALRRRGLPPELAAAALRAAGYDRDYRVMLLRDCAQRPAAWLLRAYPRADLQHARPQDFGSRSYSSDFPAWRVR